MTQEGEPMNQGTLFGADDGKRKRKGKGQAGLGFGYGPDPGRRGEMPTWWLDTVLGAYQAAGRATPCLATLQGLYDAGVTAADVTWRFKSEEGGAECPS